MSRGVFLGSALSVFLLTGVGCGQAPESAEPVAPPELIPAGWLGDAAGAARPVLEPLGEVKLHDQLTEEDLAQQFGRRLTANELGPSSSPATSLKEQAFIGIDLRTRQAYRMRVDRGSLSRVAAEMARQGLNVANRGTVQDDVGQESKGVGEVSAQTWSDGVDTRIRRAIADGYAANSWPLRTIGHLSAGCSGALVGRRVVLTAAHCLVKSYTFFDPVYSTFTPRRDGDTAPWGVHAPVWYWVPEEYINGTCSSAGNCNAWDVGVMVLADEWTSGHPGWMGHWNVSSNTMKTWTIYMRGYPGCSGASAPASCTSRTLYGDTKVCGVGSTFSPDADGWDREASVSCDGSPGQSGSPFYSYDAPVNGPVVVGQYNQYLCTGTGCAGNSYPNLMGHLTPSLNEVISYFKSTYP